MQVYMLKRVGNVWVSSQWLLHYCFHSCFNNLKTLTSIITYLIIDNVYFLIRYQYFKCISINDIFLIYDGEPLWKSVFAVNDVPSHARKNERMHE